VYRESEIDSRYTIHDFKKGLSLIFLTFLFPLAVYLLVLGVINRRRRPLLVSGVWDGVGLLFAVSGFLLFAGPAVFSSLNERWRVYWLLGQSDAALAGPDGVWQLWVFLSIVYFALVVGGAVYYFWRQRHVTAIYHVEAEEVEQAVTGICEGLGLDPVHSGGMFLFGLSAGLAPERRVADGKHIQAPHYLPAVVRDHKETMPPVAPQPLAPDNAVLGQTVILELDHFPLMSHVTLRWDPADAPLRQLIESELSRQLAETPAPDGVLGAALLALGFFLLTCVFAGAFLLVAFSLARH
jgi:hypothetical protein